MAKTIIGTTSYLEHISEEMFMKKWLETEKSNARWKLIKLLAKLKIKSACDATGITYVDDGTGFQATS